MKPGVFVILLFIIVSSKAQDVYQFKNTKSDLPEIRECKLDDLLGETISLKLEQFNRVYTKKVNCGPPSFITSTEIQKPDLYYSVQKLVKYYRKCLKKETLSHEKIEKQMVDILNKCVQIVNQETKPIEQELRNANNSKEIAGVFERIIIE